MKDIFLATVRRILRKGSTVYIEIAGLTLGITAYLFIFNYVFFELNYDHLNDDRSIYRLETHSFEEETLKLKDAFTSSSLGPILDSSFTQITTSRLIPYSESGQGFFKKQKGEFNFLLDHVYFSDSSVFNVLGLNLVRGCSKSSLTNPNSIVLSTPMAREIFKDEWKNGLPILGKVLRSGERGLIQDTFVVTGILGEVPRNTHLSIDALVSINSSGLNIHSRTDPVYTTYTYAQIESEHLLAKIETTASKLISRGQKVGLKKRITPIAIGDIHNNSGVSNDPGNSINRSLLFFLSAVGVIVLILAYTNYVISTILSSINRAKEIAMRRLLGIKPSQLVRMFVGEALILSVLSGCLAIFLFYFGVQLNSNYKTGIQYLTIGEIDFITSTVFLILILLLTTLVSSLYPSYYFLSLSPSSLLKGRDGLVQTREFKQGNQVLKFLLIGQICTSMIFLSAVFIVYKQLDHMEKSDRASFEFNIKGVFPGNAGADEAFSHRSLQFFDDLLASRSVSSISVGNMYNGEIKTSLSIDSLFLLSDSIANFQIQLSIIDNSYWKDSSDVFLYGKNFRSLFGFDHDKVIVNESAWQFLKKGLTDSENQYRIKSRAGYLTLTGIVKNQKPDAPPKVYLSGYRYPTYFEIGLEYPGRAGEKLADFIQKWEYSFSRNFPYFYFLDKGLEKTRDLEENVFRLFLFFSGVALIITNLGMFGLAGFITQKRTKEIAIRKILGASGKKIFIVLLLDFFKLIMIGCLLAIPVVIFFTRLWLENYPQRIEVVPSLVVYPFMMLVLISTIVIFEKCWKTSNQRDLNSLASAD
ncbi:MAG: FtsX-like permease family protein [Balneolaceae bacterium]